MAIVANESVAQRWNLQIVHSHIEDNPSNKTRFLLISKHVGEPSGNDISLFTFGVNDTPGKRQSDSPLGALSSVLAVFSKHGINLSVIESYPDRHREFGYGFFISLKGHAKDSAVKKAIKEIEPFTTFLLLKGVFPAFE